MNCFVHFSIFYQILNILKKDDSHSLGISEYTDSESSG